MLSEEMKDKIEEVQKWWKDNWNLIYKCPLAKTCMTAVRFVVIPEAEFHPGYADEVCRTEEHKKCTLYVEMQALRGVK